MSLFHQPGGDPAGTILDVTKAAEFDVNLTGGPKELQGSVTHDGAGIHPWIEWNANPAGTYSDGVQRDGCSTLYHELSHVAISQAAGVRRDLCFIKKGDAFTNTGIPVDEVEATRDENAYRFWRGLPRRTVYGDFPLPADDQQCYWHSNPSSKNPFPVAISGTFALFSSPPPFFTSGSVTFATMQIPSCATNWGCEYSTTRTNAFLHYGSDECSGDGTAPPWLETQDVGLQFTNAGSNSNQIWRLNFGFAGHIELTLQCVYPDGRTEKVPGVAVISGLSPSAGLEWHPGMMDMKFNIQVQDGRRGTVSLEFSPSATDR